MLSARCFFLCLFLPFLLRYEGMIDGFRYNTQTRDFIVESEYENVDLIPANDQTPRLSKRLEDLYTDAQRDYDRGDPKYLASDTDVLDYFLRQVKDEYDYILIDTQPSRDQGHPAG